MTKEWKETLIGWAVLAFMGLVLLTSLAGLIL